jgi:hypothetical protein
MEELIAGVSANELKTLGLSNADLEFIRERSADYKADLARLSPGTSAPLRAMIVGAFETGLIVGLAKARNLTKVSKRIGF